MPLDVERVDRELARRQAGHGRGGRMRIERDTVEVLSGTRAGLTIGSPIALRVANRDSTIEALPVPGDPRPGHADLAGCQQLGVRDPRAVLERASARETAARVALGGVARQLLEAFDVELFAHVVELAGDAADPAGWERAGGDAAVSEREALREASPFLSLDPAADERWRARVDEAKEKGDTLGGVYEVRVLGLPPGLGTYARTDERLTGRLGGALLSIPAMKGVEFGLGFESARRPGSEVMDPIELDGEARYGRFGRGSNNAGGLEGGMTTGAPLVARVAMKPIPTLRRGLPTVEFASGESVQATYQRSDVTSVPAASVVGEAVCALELARAFLARFGGASLDQVRDTVEAWRARVDGI
jgi:chorismate synthase